MPQSIVAKASLTLPLKTISRDFVAGMSILNNPVSPATLYPPRGHTITDGTNTGGDSHVTRNFCINCACLHPGGARKPGIKRRR